MYFGFGITVWNFFSNVEMYLVKFKLICGSLAIILTVTVKELKYWHIVNNRK